MTATNFCEKQSRMNEEQWKKQFEEMLVKQQMQLADYEQELYEKDQYIQQILHKENA